LIIPIFHILDTNREVFLKNSVAQGVYCPNRDAAWEIDNQYDDQLAINRTKECNVSSGCTYNNEPNEDGTIKEIILCGSCGANGAHIGCDPVSKRIFCPPIRTIFKK